MSKEEVQALVANAILELQTENAALKERAAHLEAISTEQAKTIEKLEAHAVRLYYKIGRLEVSEKDWEDFDPAEYTVPFESMLAEMDFVHEATIPR